MRKQLFRAPVALAALVAATSCAHGRQDTAPQQPIAQQQPQPAAQQPATQSQIETQRRRPSLARRHRSLGRSPTAAWIRLNGRSQPGEDVVTLRANSQALVRRGGVDGVQAGLASSTPPQGSSAQTGFTPAGSEPSPDATAATWAWAHRPRPGEQHAPHESAGVVQRPRREPGLHAAVPVGSRVVGGGARVLPHEGLQRRGERFRDWRRRRPVHLRAEQRGGPHWSAARFRLRARDDPGVHGLRAAGVAAEVGYNFIALERLALTGSVGGGYGGRIAGDSQDEDFASYTGGEDGPYLKLGIGYSW